MPPFKPGLKYGDQEDKKKKVQEPVYKSPKNNQGYTEYFRQKEYEKYKQAEAEYRARFERQRQEALRRQLAEKRAREEAERRRREEAERRRLAAQSRSDYMRQRRLARHTVRRGDTAESIASQYGVSPQDVASRVTSLRPGQRLEFERPRFDTEVPPGAQGQPGAGPIPLAMARNTLATGDFVPWVTRNIAGLMPTVMRALSRFGQMSQQPGRLDQFLGLEIPDWQMNAAQQLEGLGQTADEIEQSQEWQRMVAGGVPRADLSKYEADRLANEPIFQQIAEMERMAQIERGIFASTMRYTGQALAYAYDAMASGDPDWQRYISNSDGEVVLYLTDGRWESGPMIENFSPDMLEKIQAMGFIETAPGFWEMPRLEPPDYGMGGFEFPGFGGYGGFGGGGDYEYLSRGGQMRRKEGGGKSGGDAYRIFPEGVPATHWRI